MKTKLFFLFICGAFITYSQAQFVPPAIQWQKCLGGTASDHARSIKQTTDGGYIVAGYSYSNDGDVSAHHGEIGYFASADYWIVKTDSAGTIQWQKSLGGTSHDVAWSIQQTADGGYIVAGHSFSNDDDVSGHHGTSDESDYWIVKLNSTGAIQWQKSLGGSYEDEATSIQQTTDGGYIVAGYSMCFDGDVSGNHGARDYWIVKLNSTGTIQWQKCLGGTFFEEAYSIQQTTDGGYIVAGASGSNNGDMSGHHGSVIVPDYGILKLDSTGTIQWQKSLGGTEFDGAFSIQQTTDGGYIIAGLSSSTNGDVSGHHGYGDYWIVKLDSAGTIQWQKSLGGTSGDEARSIQQTTDGGYIVAGSSYSNDGDVTGHHEGFFSNTDIWIAKLDNAGTIQWQRSLGGTDFEGTYSIQQTTDGGYIVAGNSYSIDGDVSGNHGYSDFWIVKLAPPACIATKPTITPGGPTANLCPGQSVTLTSSPASAYLWSTGADEQIIAATASGSYTVTVTDVNGCQNISDPVIVTYLGCAAPAGLIADNITATSARIRWNAVTCAIGYRYQYKRQGTTTWTTMQQPGRLKTITGLLPSTTYQWRVLTGCKLAPDTVASGYTTGLAFTTASVIAATDVSSIAEYNNNFEVKLYPNPSKGKITVALNSINTGQIQLRAFDITGKQVFNKTEAATKGFNIYQLNLLHLISGIYYLELNNDNRQHRIKFVIAN